MTISERLVDNTVAFSSRAIEGATSYSSGETIIFDSPVTNMGGAFDPLTSVFTCPVHGIYLFSFALSVASDKRMEGTLQVNNLLNVQAVVAATEGWNQNANTAILECHAGDWVKVICGPVSSSSGEITNDNYAPMNTFSGVLLKMLTSA